MPYGKKFPDASLSVYRHIQAVNFLNNVKSSINKVKVSKIFLFIIIKNKFILIYTKHNKISVPAAGLPNQELR